MAGTKKFFSVLGHGEPWAGLIRNFSQQIREGLGGDPCDLAIFFVSEPAGNFDAAGFSRALYTQLGVRVAIGCASSGVIGGSREIEMEAGISVMAMHLPGVKLTPFQISASDSQYLRTGPELIQFLDIYPTDKPRFICLADPATCDIQQLLSAFNDGYKGLPVIGGLASGGESNWLSLNGELVNEGAVGVALEGDIEFEVTVSQGCRPIGKPFVITKADDMNLRELSGRPAVEALRELLDTLPARDRELSEHSLFVGLVMNESQQSFKRGDFLVRNIMGFDPDSGALVIGAHLRVGQTLQFQLRDAETSSEDLVALLEKNRPAPGGSSRGARLVSCTGRGRGLYGEPDHDAKTVQSLKGPLPLTGFFANGEIGPIGSKNFIHGYTSSLVILK